MSFNNEITIHPHDLQEIVDTISSQPFREVPIIIRDTGNEFVVRDINEQLITTVHKTIEDG
jgi:hypothetical protein